MKAPLDSCVHQCATHYESAEIASLTFVRDITARNKVADSQMFKAMHYGMSTNVSYYAERFNVKGNAGLALSNSTDPSSIELHGYDIQAEDPRIFYWRNEKYILFIHFRKKYGRILAITKYNHFDPIPLHIKSERINRVEKNWGPFVKDNELYIVYNYDPLVILHYDGNLKGLCKVVYKQNGTNLPVDTAPQILRGGSNLVPYDKNERYFIAGCHSRVAGYSELKTIFFTHFTHLLILDTLTSWQVIYASKPLLFPYTDVIFYNGVNYTFLNKSIYFDNTMNIQDPVSINRLTQNEYVFTSNIQDQISLEFLLHININNIIKNHETSQLPFKREISYWNSQIKNYTTSLIETRKLCLLKQKYKSN